jgi:2-C-methyl-D-erythritol 4-phosphate cytidylyltransferase/2-C-methyl-D-erythritol 2,4-cyclodiphosphate synthase
MSVAVVLVAAGNGERLGANLPKALVPIGQRSLLAHALDSIFEYAPSQIIVVGHPLHLNEFAEILSGFPQENLVLVPGAQTRQQSVAIGVALVSQDLVLVHDAARCFAPAKLFQQVEAALSDSQVIVPVLPVTDTIKRIVDSKVLETINRTELGAAQTPQGFIATQLLAALKDSEIEFTDEAALMQSKGYSVTAIQGDALAYKVTTAADLAKATAGLGQDSMKHLTGIGTDAHEFSDSEQLVLGCLTWPELPKLRGHSDGDAIAHAIVDALLSAAGLGDIGSNFGVDKPEYQGASGELFLRETLLLLQAKNLIPVNVAVQVIADKPKIGPRRLELETRLSAVIQAVVSVGATTTDGLGFLADSRGIAAVATALIRVRD